MIHESLSFVTNTGTLGAPAESRKNKEKYSTRRKSTPKFEDKNTSYRQGPHRTNTHDPISVEDSRKGCCMFELYHTIYALISLKNGRPKTCATRNRRIRRSLSKILIVRPGCFRKHQHSNRKHIVFLGVIPMLNLQRNNQFGFCLASAVSQTIVWRMFGSDL